MPAFLAPACTRKSAPLMCRWRSSDGLGYYIAAANGRILNFAGALFDGSLAHSPPPVGVGVIALLASTLAGQAVAPLPHHVFGYDILEFPVPEADLEQGPVNLPPSSSISILEAAGWLDNEQPLPCLGGQLGEQAAGTEGAPFELYLFLNAPGTSAVAKSLDATGRGTCSAYTGLLAQECVAYNYGYNGAGNPPMSAQRRQASVRSSGGSTSSSCCRAHVLQLWHQGVLVVFDDAQCRDDPERSMRCGQTVSSSASTRRACSTRRSPATSRRKVHRSRCGSPGVPWTKPPYNESGLLQPRALQTWCAGTAVYAGSKSKAAFAGGVPWILQETPGSIASPYSLDPDYTC